MCKLCYNIEVLFNLTLALVVPFYIDGWEQEKHNSSVLVTSFLH